VATVYNGIDLSLYPLQKVAGDSLVFLGRIHPDTGVHLAIEVAQLSRLPLLIAGMIQDPAYFQEHVEPHLGAKIRYIGPVDVPGKNALLARALALLYMNTIPERFGLVLAEAKAAGVPVIAMDLGSCREVIEEGRTGFLVHNPREAVQRLQNLAEIDRSVAASVFSGALPPKPWWSPTSVSTRPSSMLRPLSDDKGRCSQKIFRKPDPHQGFDPVSR
jgi:glycosyltransferase involved in cell wall biosynthesis